MTGKGFMERFKKISDKRLAEYTAEKEAQEAPAPQEAAPMQTDPLLSPSAPPLHPKEAPTQDTAEKEKEPVTSERIVFLSPLSLDQYEHDPFREYDDYRLELLTQSIRENGIMAPLIVRPKGDRYEMLAGRHRNNAAKALGLESVPCIVKDVDNDEAAIIVTESNLRQREGLLPSEKAYAYKMQFDARKNREKKRDFEGAKSFTDAESLDNFLIGNIEGKEDNSTTIYRYIRLTHLDRELLEQVDSGKLALFAAEHLSYLGSGEQLAVLQYFIAERRAPLDIATAKKLREHSQTIELTYAEIERLLQKKKKAKEPAFQMKMTKLREYLPSDLSKKRDIEKYIMEALAYFRERQNKAEE